MGSLIGLVVIFAVLWLTVGLPDLVEDLSSAMYNNKFLELDVSKVNGDRLVVYDTQEKVYTKDYLTKELCAGKPADVGGVVKVTRSFASTSYSGGVSRKREILNVSLYHCKMGTYIAETTFEAKSPMMTSSSGTDHVDEEKVSAWISSNWKR